MADRVSKFLKQCSQQASESELHELEKNFSIEGHLNSSAIGSIRVVRKIKHSGPKRRSKTITSALGDGLYVRKKLDLEDQNHQALVKTDAKRRKLKTARGLSADDVIFMEPHRKEVGQWASLQGRPWRGQSAIVKIAWLEKQLAKQRDGATSLVLCNEFLNEATVGYLVTQDLATKVPHQIRQHAAFINEGQGNLILDQAGMPFERACVDMSLLETQSVLLQVLVALHVGMSEAHLKHHDMHLENVFVNRVRDSDTFNNLQLNSSSIWEYNLRDVNGICWPIQIRNKGLLAKIGDWGLSSITDTSSKKRVERVDYLDLDASEVEWGLWNGNLEDHTSQDVVTLLSKFFQPDELQQVPPDTAAFCQSLFLKLQEDYHVRASNIGRPLDTSEKSPRICIVSLLRKQLPDVFVKPEQDTLLIYDASKSV